MLYVYDVVIQEELTLSSRHDKDEYLKVPEGVAPSGTVFFGKLHTEKSAMYQQASPFGDKRQVVGISQALKGFRNIPDKSVFG